MGKRGILIFCIFSLLLIPLMVNASFTVSGGVYGRIFGNTGEWFELDTKSSEYYELNLSFGIFAQVLFNSMYGVEAGMMTWDGEYQTDFYDPSGAGLKPRGDVYDINSVSPYFAIVVRPVKYLFASMGKYFSGDASLKNNFFLRVGGRFPFKKMRLPLSVLLFGDYYLNKNDGENFWTVNIGVQIN